MNSSCSHLQNICIAQVNLEQLKIEVDDGGLKGGRRNSFRCQDDDSSEHRWNCVTCGTANSPWLCLSCGLIHCGRYQNRDALRHFQSYKTHCIAMDCYATSVYCYMCDNFISEDTDDKKIESVRKSLRLHCKARAADHIYSSRTYDSCDDEIEESDSPLDEGTEEEEEIHVVQNSMSPQSPQIFVVDEDQDSGSVPEDEFSIQTMPLPVISRKPEVTPMHPPLPFHVSNSAPQLGNLAHSMVRGGHLLRARKRKLSPSSNASTPSRPSSTLSVKSVDLDRRRGLSNLGNTCFMNCVVQALTSVDWFQDFMCSLPLLEADSVDQSSDSPPPRYNTRRASAPQPESSKPIQETLFVEELRKVLLEIVSRQKVQAFSPDSLFNGAWKLNSRFRGFQQQDAHEFLRMMLDRVHSDLRKCRIPEDAEQRFARSCGSASLGAAESAISRMFEGALLSQVTCLICSSASNIQDPFLDLSLELVLPTNRSGTVPLTDCIRRFFEKEELDHCEQYMCARCGERRPSTKQLFLKSLPNVLCLHLKRFRWLSHRGKLDFMVEFPLTGLDMSAYLAPNVQPSGVSSSVYDLCSVIVHQGSGVSSGHYTTFGLHNGSWWHYNDAIVKASNEACVLKQKAYLLFYTRRTES